MQYQALLLGAARVECALQAPAAPRDNPELRSAPVQWTVISLVPMQRVQRPAVWETLVNDARSLLPQVVAAAQLKRPLDAVIRNPPVGWEEPTVRNAMLRLFDTGDRTHSPLEVDGETIYVDAKQSVTVVDGWQWSPSAMIAKIGREAAGELLRVYLSLQLFADVPPEVQIFDRSEQLLLDVGSLAGPPPHRGASVIVTAHRMLHTGERRLVALYDIFMLPTAVPQAYRAMPLGDGSGNTPAAFPQFSARLQLRPGSAWNNYNVGWRATAYYAQPGDSLAGAVRSFNDSAGKPFIDAIGSAAQPPVIATQEARGALLLEVSDFGNDPILEALIKPADAVNVAQSAPPRSSFARTAQWSPRRVESTWFLPPLPDDWNVEPKPLPQTDDEIAEAVEIFRKQRDTIERAPEFERKSVFGDSGVSVADMWRQTGTELVWQTKYDPGFGRVAGDTSGHVIPIDKTLDITKQLNWSLLKHRIDALTIEEAYRLSPPLAPVLAALMLREGQNYSVLHLADQGAAALNVLPRSPAVTTAHAIVATLQRKIFQLRSLSSRLFGAPTVDERMSFASVHLEPTKRLNPRISLADIKLLSDFSLLGARLIGESLLAPTADDGIDYADIIAQAHARTLALRAGLPPAVTAAVVKAAAKPVVPPPVIVAPPPVVVASGWAFNPTLYPKLTAAINALALPPDTAISTTRLLVNTDLLQYVTTPSPTVVPLTDAASKNYLATGWLNINLMPGGQALLDALTALQTPLAPPVVVQPQPPVIVQPPPPVVVDDATKAAKKRAQLQRLFGNQLSVQLDDSQAAALPDQLDSLVSLDALLSGQALLESLSLPSQPSLPQQPSDEAVALRNAERAEQLKKIGFPPEFLQTLNAAPDEDAKKFMDLKPFSSLSSERMSRALGLFTSP